MTPRLLSAEPPSPGRTASTWLARLSPVLVVGAIWAVAVLAYAESSPSRVAIALALAFVPYGFFALGEVGRPLSLRVVLGLALVAAGLLLRLRWNLPGVLALMAAAGAGLWAADVV